MAYTEHKPDSKLVETPVTEICGNPSDWAGEQVTHGGVEFENAGTMGQHKESAGVIETVTYVEDLDRGKADVEVGGYSRE